MPMNIADVQDSYLNATLHAEWLEEYEENYWDPEIQIILANLATELSNEELDALSKIDPETYMKVMAKKEEMVKMNERRTKEVENGLHTTS